MRRWSRGCVQAMCLPMPPPGNHERQRSGPCRAYRADREVQNRRRGAQSMIDVEATEEMPRQRSRRKQKGEPHEQLGVAKLPTDRGDVLSLNNEVEQCRLEISRSRTRPGASPIVAWKARPQSDPEVSP